MSMTYIPEQSLPSSQICIITVLKDRFALTYAYIVSIIYHHGNGKRNELLSKLLLILCEFTWDFRAFQGLYLLLSVVLLSLGQKLKWDL